ncbi:MAG TPA: hypothetical protein VIJ04_16855 [Xanthobacteraceae bacterium]
MSGWLRKDRWLAAAAASCALALGSCASNQPAGPAPAVEAPAGPEVPSTIRAEEVVGRWGYGSFHRPEDLVRTEAAARAACGEPVVINRGPSGGVMMYLADNAQLQELELKGSQSGQNYIGPPGPAGGKDDRQIVSFDGRAMVLKWLDPEVASRYGTSVYVRCAPEGAPHTARRAPAKPKPKPKPAPAPQ